MDIQAFLSEHQIPTDDWGKGDAKTVEHLQAEVDCGDSIVVYDEAAGVPIRTIKVLAVTVLCTHWTGKYRLVEDRQVFTGGRERRRKLLHSLGEKVKADVEPDDAEVKRAIREELNILLLQNISWQDPFSEQGESDSYPGLPTKYLLYPVTVHIFASDLKFDGHVEEQKDKKTYFVWTKDQ